MTDASPGPGANRVYIDPGDRRTAGHATPPPGHMATGHGQLGPALGQAFTTLFAHFIYNFGQFWDPLRLIEESVYNGVPQF